MEKTMKAHYRIFIKVVANDLYCFFIISNCRICFPYRENHDFPKCKQFLYDFCNIYFQNVFVTTLSCCYYLLINKRYCIIGMLLNKTKKQLKNKENTDVEII